MNTVLGRVNSAVRSIAVKHPLRFDCLNENFGTSDCLSMSETIGSACGANRFSNPISTAGVKLKAQQIFNRTRNFAIRDANLVSQIDCHHSCRSRHEHE